MNQRSQILFTDLLDGPHYTRPENFRGLKVPDILLSGHHENIKKWQKEQRERKLRIEGLIYGKSIIIKLLIEVRYG